MSTKTELQQLYRDITVASAVAEVPYNEAVIWDNLGAFEQFFSNGAAIALRTTTKSVDNRDLSVRYVDLERPHDPYAIALEKGLYTPQGHPIDNVYPEIQARIPLLGSGVDFSVKHGFEKIWPFFAPALPLEQVLSLRSIPASVHNYVGHFEKFGLQYVSLFALDYWNKTFNLYFMFKERHHFTPAQLANMIEDAGFPVPSQEELDLDATNVSVYQTFSWESPYMERLCFVLAGTQDDVPTHLHPVFKRFANEAPIKAPKRLFTFNTTYSRRGNYLKIEADYTATMGVVLGKCITAVP